MSAVSRDRRSASGSVRERDLQIRWNELWSGAEFKTVSGDRVRILSNGLWNTERGPDFINARIQINGEERIGDIEIHRLASDFYAHGHDTDPFYAHVILHVVQKMNDRAPPLPTLLLEPQVEDAFCLSNTLAPGDCARYLAEIPDPLLVQILKTAGVERFMLRSELLSRLILHAGAEQAFLTILFDIAGYKNNRGAFAQLLQRILTYDSAVRHDEIECLLWGESGLLPDPSIKESVCSDYQAFVEKMWADFWKIRKSSDTQPIAFSHCGCRPCGNPERRLGALCVYLKKHGATLIDHLLALARTPVAPERLIEILLDDMTFSDAFYDRLFTFTHAPSRKVILQGSSRANDTVINGILPFLYAYALSTHDTELKERALRAWEHLPESQDNHVIKNAMLRCFGADGLARAERLLDSAAARQGLQHLFIHFCEQNQCVCGTCALLQALRVQHSTLQENADVM